MVSPVFAITASERVLPRLSLDFTTTVLSPLISFSRSGNTATRINSSGLVESVLANAARFDYDPVTLACKGLLIEESRANLFTYSGDLTNASWDFTGTARTANAGVAPDGTTTATRVQFSANSFLYKNNVPAAGSSFTISVWVKSYGGANQTIRLFGNGVTTLSSDITVTSSWQRVSFTFNFTAATSGFTTASGQAADVLMWGAQLEAGDFLTSYISTTTASVTRNADIATLTGQGVVAQGTFVLDATVVSGKTLLTSGSVTLAATASSAQKTAVAYDASSVLKSINAGSVSVAAGATASTDITLGNGGYFRSLEFWDRKLLNVNIQVLSSQRGRYSTINPVIRQII